MIRSEADFLVLQFCGENVNFATCLGEQKVNPQE